METQGKIIDFQNIIHELPQLLSYLRISHGFDISIHTTVSIQSMLLQLAANGQLPDHPTRLRSLMSPLICKTSDQQRDFCHIFNEWIDRITPSQQAQSKSLSPATQDFNRMQYWMKWLICLTLLLILGFAIPLFWWDSSSPPNKSISESQSLPNQSVRSSQSSDSNKSISDNAFSFKLMVQRQTGWILGGMILLIVFLGVMIFRWLMDRHIARHHSDEDVTMLHLRVEAFTQPLFHSLAYSKTIREFHGFRPLLSDKLDIQKTLETSLQKWPDLTPVYHYYYVRPQYLVLIDQTSLQDHQAKFIALLVQHLVLQKVYIHVYYFDGDPRVCTGADQPGVYISLIQLAHRYPSHRLLIFSDAREFIDPLSGKPFQWTHLFSFWPDRALLIPDPLFPKSGNHPLHDRHFLIFSASPEGLAHLIHAFNEGHVLYTSMIPNTLPGFLLSSQYDWCGYHPPSDDQLDLLIMGLRDYLDSASFFWLCACAVYPHLLWQLTLYLGAKLKTKDANSLFNEKRLSIVSSLPWFRVGYMPDWFRRKLLANLSVEQEKQVRQLLYAMLSKVETVKKEADRHFLMHTFKYGLIKRLIQRLIKHSQSQTNPLSPVHDRIFIQFLENRLSVRIASAVVRSILNTSKHMKQVVQSKDTPVTPLPEKQTNIEPPAPGKPKTKIEPNTQMEFIWIEGGCYMMGQSDDEKKQIIDERGKDVYNLYSKRELPRHEVCVSGFWFAKYPVTVGQFRQFVLETQYKTDAEKAGESYTLQDDRWQLVKGVHWQNPGFEQDDDHPVVCISWNDSVALTKWLSEKHQRPFRLPTEAEWEYACRAGTTTFRFWGDDPSQACQYANVADLTLKKRFNYKYYHNCDDGYVYTSPVGSFLPNPWGLYDMLGNVWEWCADAFDEEAYLKHEKNNPVMELEGASFRVLRGGSWFNSPASVRCAARLRSRPSDCNTYGSLRLLWT